MSKPRSFAPIIAAVLLLLPVLYVGSYLALVPGGRTVQAPNVRSWDFCDYRFNSPMLALLYRPLERTDRKLRPGSWRQFRSMFDPPIQE